MANDQAESRSPAQAKSQLSLGRILAYALPAFPLSALSLPLGVYIPPLYAENTTLTLGLVGTLFFVSRILDVFTDPAFGVFADRINPPLGRRRFWMIISTPILMFSTWQLFHPPADAGATYLLIWVGVLYIGYTMAFISHLAWGAELSGHYDDRSRVLGWREIAVISGMLTVLILPALLEGSGSENPAATRAHLMAVVVVIALPISILITSLTVPDPPAKPTEHTPALSDIFAIAKNRFMPRVLAADLATTVAIGITASLYIWLIEHVLHLPEATSLILLIYFGVAVLTTPIWMRLAVRFEKHTVFVAAVVYGALSLSLYAFTPGRGLPIALIATGLYGVTYGASFFLARAIVADIADDDTLTHGTERMGTFFSGLSLTSKIGFAFGPLIAYNILDIVGFDPKAPVATEAQSAWLLGVYIAVPATLFVIAAIIIRKHKLTRAAHTRIRQELEKRHA